tara:strand:+ start:333 stop:629 length:297 start_codon:yes stop_codon:yes gene_type:complete
MKKNHQVVVFMAEWCPHCANMKKYVWTDDRVRQAMAEFHNSKPAYVICSKPQNRHLVDEFEIERYPTVVIMDEDHNIKKRANNMDAEEVVNFLQDFNE